MDEAEGAARLTWKYYILMSFAINVLNSRKICDCPNDVICSVCLSHYPQCNHSRETESHQHK